MDFLSCVKPQKSLIWPGKTALLWAQEAKGMSSAASPPHFFFSVPAPHALRAPLALCSPLILHWTVRMDFAVLSQLKKKRLYHIEMSIRFPPPMRWGIFDPQISTFWPFIFMNRGPARLASFQQPAESTSVYDRAQ